MAEVCFARQDFNLYLFLLVCIIAYMLYILYQHRESMVNVDLLSTKTQDELRRHIIELQESLYGCRKSEQKCQIDLQQHVSQQSSVRSIQQNLFGKIYNPLVPPERVYPGGRLNRRGFGDYQQIGFVFAQGERYPLYARYKYPGKSDKWEYYIIDETRNKLKIPFKSKNDNEIYDGDAVDIPNVGTFNAKIYEYENFRYDSNLL